MLQKLFFISAFTLILFTAESSFSKGMENDTVMTYKQVVEKSFEDWQRGQGSPFSLLNKNFEWVIAGSNRYAGRYNEKSFNEELIKPFNERLAQPLKPTDWKIYQDGDVVVVHFSASASLKDGSVYSNSYAWFFEFSEGDVSKVTAFLDMPAFEDVLNIVVD